MNTNGNASDERLDKHIRSLSHDIRNSLAVISLYSRYVAETDNLNPSEIKQCAMLIEQKAKQAEVLLDYLLNGTKHNEMYVKDGKTMLVELIKESGICLRNKFLFQIDMDGCSPFSGDFDVDALRRVFDNLVSNVERYADSQYVVKLKMTTTKTDLLIEQENIKDKDESFSDGSGLGLNIIQHIVENHTGSLAVTQDSEKFKVKIILPIITNTANSIAD